MTPSTDSDGPSGPQIVSAALMLRDDGQLLLVQHPQAGPDFGGLWSLPMQPVAGDGVAEAAIESLLRERLHVQPGSVEFNDTIYFAGAAGGRFIVNVFTCDGWSGEPRFADDDYEDAAWVLPGSHGALPLIPELAQWLTDALDGAAASIDRETLIASLASARRDLLDAFDAIPEPAREQPFDESDEGAEGEKGGWSALDVLAHAASVEAYYAAESRRLLEVPGHSWRQFNEGQWEDDHRARPRESEAAVLVRLNAVRDRTSAWVATLDGDQLDGYGNHPERGVVTIGERIDKIARHDREHAAQLASFDAGAGTSVNRENPENRNADAAADR